ncbi:MAG: SLATT domain-containing protein [Verrucomicrobia bacterium]|nr:SLATT domain-containing protein [Verrucomicrobiota bacterium]
MNPPARLGDSDLPRTFQDADRHAIFFQGRHVRYLKAHVILGVVGASVAQMSYSLTGRTFFALALALCVLALLVTRVLVQKRPRCERIWCRSRAAAEQVRSLSWAYMMDAERSAEGRGFSNGASAADAELADAIERIRAEWLQAVETPAMPPAAQLEITERMKAVRAGPHSDKVRLYLDGRVQDQATWYQGKAAFNQKRRRVFMVLAVLCELGAAGLAIAMVVHLARPAAGTELEPALKNLLTFVWPCLAGATGALGWSNFRRHAELAGTYQRSAEQLAKMEKEMETLAEDSAAHRQAFEKLVRECEELLTRENAIWFTRRTA